MQEWVLLPQPRHIAYQAGHFILTHKPTIHCQGDPKIVLPLAQRLQTVFENLFHIQPHLKAQREGIEIERGILIRLIPQLSLPPQGYQIRVTARKIEIQARTAVGLFYGVMTLQQMARQSDGKFAACLLDDFPDFPSRGVMLDVSRDKVPTLQTLMALIDQLAEWKINHVELYTEHTFAYQNHSEVWAQASPLTGEEILVLDAYCRERFIELVPNQNSFGHLHHWLELPRYRPLAECPNGFDWPWGGRSERPFSLAPTHPQSLELLEELYTELLPHFTSKKFNVGLDETVDLGQGQSKTACEIRGKGRVYLDFLLQVHKLVEKQGHTMHFWGDIILQHPELVAELPQDAVVLEWGYEAEHPFATHGELFAQSGLPFYVCPGTSSWCSISGRTKNCLENLKNAARNGLKHGAIGYLITDWGDRGHWQYLPFSYFGFSVGAGLAWCYATNHSHDFAQTLNLHVFQDHAGVMGNLVQELGNAYLHVGHCPKNASAIFHMLYRPLSQTLPEKVTKKSLHHTMDFIRQSIAPLHHARMARADACLIVDEFLNAERFLLHGCARGLALKTKKMDDGKMRETLAKELAHLLGEHRRLWRMRNREGGLHDSTKVLEARWVEYTALEAPVERFF